MTQQDHMLCPLKLHICTTGPHYARFDCQQHHVFVKWASKSEVLTYLEIVKEKTSKGYLNK